MHELLPFGLGIAVSWMSSRVASGWLRRVCVGTLLAGAALGSAFVTGELRITAGFAWADLCFASAGAATLALVTRHCRSVDRWMGVAGSLQPEASREE